MAKLTSKYQFSLPKSLALKAGLAPGDELECEAADDAVRIRKKRARASTRSVTDRLILFDLATERQLMRNQQAAIGSDDRGWTRDDLYERGR